VYPVSSRAALVLRSRMPWHFAENREHDVVQTKKTEVGGNFVPETQGALRRSSRSAKCAGLPCRILRCTSQRNAVKSPMLNAKPLTHPSHKARAIWFPSATLHGSTGADAARIAWKLSQKRLQRRAFPGFPAMLLLNFTLLFNALHPDHGFCVSFKGSHLMSR
jgi:hypothetical protein